MQLPISRLSVAPNSPFPPVENSLKEPNGLLAYGGDLSATRLLNAYHSGIFPWYEQDGPILWWSPDPRALFLSTRVHLSKRFRKELKSSTWHVTADTVFEKVIAQCATIPRAQQDGTWIHPEMQKAYLNLHNMGYGHSIEVFDGKDLIGGLYGVAIGKMFFAESMFSARSGGSKVALAALGRFLAKNAIFFFDAQMLTPHLVSMGAIAVPRAQFIEQIQKLTNMQDSPRDWSLAIGDFPANRL